MIENLFLLSVAAGALLGLANWRTGMLFAVVLDCVRDPVRKLVEGEPTLITYCVCIIWGTSFLNLLFGPDRILSTFARRFPWVIRSTNWYIIGLIPGAAISFVLYQNGWLLAALGFASYAAPLLGIVLGMTLISDAPFLKRLLQVYVVANCITLFGSVAEFYHWDWPALGGLSGFEWIRHMPGVIVDLISGFFRSPDIAGFHAANALMVSMILLLNRGDKPGLRRKLDPMWLCTAMWTVIPLMLCGRRKMLLMPIVFFAAYLLYMQIAARCNVGKMILYATIIAATAAIPLCLWRDEATMQDHQAYYATTLGDVAPRLKDNVAQGVVHTVKQSGWLGSGLGVATQGAQHFADEAREDVWQEDGISRLFKELGVVGVGMLLIAAAIFLNHCRVEIGRQRYLPLIELQALFFSLIAANASSFVASHQHFSGDPANALWVLLFVGAFIGSLAYQSAPPTNRGLVRSAVTDSASLAR